MGKTDYFPRPWRVTTTSKQLHKGGGQNFHIRAYNDHYVAERIAPEVATRIVECVNERDDLTIALSATTARAKTAERYLQWMIDNASFWNPQTGEYVLAVRDGSTEDMRAFLAITDEIDKEK